ncbi:MAG: sulfotransferase [Gammaproteobacteria bacterium]
MQPARLLHAMITPTPAYAADQNRARRYLRRGMQYLEIGDLQAARNSLLQSIESDNSLADAHYQLGNCLRRCGDSQGADRALKAAIARDPYLTDAYISLAYLYHDDGRNDEAVSILQKLRTARPKDAELHFKLGGLLVKFDLCAEAETIFRNCPPSDPRHAQAQLTLGNAYQALGQFDKAEQAFLRSIEADAHADAAYLRLANSRRLQPHDAALVRKFEAVLKRSDLSASARVCLHFSLGKMHDDLGSFDEAFAHYRRGNELQHQRVQFDRQGLTDYTTRAKQAFTAGLIRRTAARTATPQPIFIVGMLRSGTTLVERILASHPQCYGLGETELVDSLTRDFAARVGKPYPECISSLTPALAETLAAALQSSWPQKALSFAMVVDKNPLNFLHLGLIAMLFPGAPILHCVRDPLDTCLSIYFQHFAHPRNTYAYDLEDIAFFYRQYLDLMEYWRTVLPGAVHEIHYDALVQNPEAGTRALIAAAGLEWHPACLESHKHSARIETASVWQVRQPIHSDSVGRWRHYESHLQALRQALDKK